MKIENESHLICTGFQKGYDEGWDRGYNQALNDFVECINIELFFTDLIDTKTKEKIEIPNEIQEFLNEYNKYIIQRLEKIAKERVAKENG
jgi:flagellar biosynthesis/type III secretory pathway protein FliH